MIGPIRSMLFAPGTRPDRFPKAMAAGADAVVFDLEDSVLPAQKAEARSHVAEYLSSGEGGGALRLVRLNAVGTAEGDADLECFAGRAGFDGVLLPKVETVGAVEVVARIFSRRGAPAAVPALLLLLESSRAVLRAADLAAADAPVAALLFGAEDFAVDMGVERTADGDEIAFARAHIALAAAAAGAEAIDAVFTDLDDDDGLRRDCRRARAVGFRGKMAIHPKQVPAINEAFTPTPADVERARRVIQAWESAETQGRGVTTLEGRMLERPIVERARRTVMLASAAARR